jgi:hypothetical protein
MAENAAVSQRRRRLEVGGWRLEVGGWRLAVGGGSWIVDRVSMTVDGLPAESASCGTRRAGEA